MNNPVSISLPNGASVTYTYVPTNHRLQSLQNLNSHGEILSSFSYGYDDVGNQSAVTDLTGPTTYVYDSLYQLTSATRTTLSSIYAANYGYDGVGNRTSLGQNEHTTSYGYDGGNEMTSGPAGSYTYDNAGNMTAAGSTSYSWDALNRMVKVSTSPSGAISYVYDGDNHRVQKITSQGTTNYFYDGNSVVAETDVKGNLLKSYTSGISFKDQQGNKFFYLFNGHGDVVNLIDINQNLVQSYMYDPFGAALGVTKDPNNCRYAGSGSVYSDDDAGLQYMFNRWYNPALGRFISRDPSGFKGGQNLYVYCGNNPITKMDVSGLCTLSLSSLDWTPSLWNAQNSVLANTGLAEDGLSTNSPAPTSTPDSTVEAELTIPSPRPTATDTPEVNNGPADPLAPDTPTPTETPGPVFSNPDTNPFYTPEPEPTEEFPHVPENLFDQQEETQQGRPAGPYSPVEPAPEAP